jgi:hypothetical protein
VLQFAFPEVGSIQIKLPGFQFALFKEPFGLFKKHSTPEADFISKQRGCIRCQDDKINRFGVKNCFKLIEKIELGYFQALF